jgi:hypothetical protein
MAGAPTSVRGRAMLPAASLKGTRVTLHAPRFVRAAAVAALVSSGCGIPQELWDFGAAFDGQLALCNDQEGGGASRDIPPPSPPPHAKVFVMRGLGEVFSGGFDSLAAKIRAAGIETNVTTSFAWPLIEIQLIAEHRTQSNPAAIVLMGHSVGCDDAVRVASHLKEQGVPVRLMVLLDATNPDPIPDNVDRCLHLYVPYLPGGDTPAELPGNPVVVAAGNTRTDLTNKPLGLLGGNPAYWCVDHFSIDASARVHNLMLEEIFALAN